MPFIHIKSLPFEPELKISRVLRAVAKEFSEITNVSLEHIHATWEYFKPGHYATHDIAPGVHHSETHVVIVDLLTPDFNDNETVKQMLLSLADSISKHAVLSRNQIFINHRRAYSEQVFDDGEIVSW